MYPPFNNRLAREAVNYALNRQALANAARDFSPNYAPFSGAAARQMVPPDVPSFRTPSHRRLPARTRRLEQRLIQRAYAVEADRSPSAYVVSARVGDFQYSPQGVCSWTSLGALVTRADHE